MDTSLSAQHHYRQEAERARQLAAMAASKDVRQALLDVAQRYEALANSAEQGGKRLTLSQDD
jgi:hypothetical protein